MPKQDALHFQEIFHLLKSVLADILQALTLASKTNDFGS